MGLDMYLKEVRYLGVYDFQKDSPEYKAGKKVATAAGLKIGVDGGVEVKVPVMYWRKANAIHGWFVKNIQNGVDDCGHYEVESKHLRALQAVCLDVLSQAELVDGEITNGYKVELVEGQMVRDPIIEPGKVMANPSVAFELLPPTPGFFFGSDEVNEWYLRDLQETVDGIERVLANKSENSWFEYHSSW